MDLEEILAQARIALNSYEESNQESDLITAVSLYSEAIELNENSILALNDRAYALTLLRRFDEATTDLTKIIGLNPEYTAAYVNLGRISNDLSEFEEAIDYLETALDLEPENPTANLNMGYALNKLKRYQEAEEYLNKAIEFDHEQEIVHLALNNLGYTLTKLERADEGAEKLREAISLKEDLPMAYTHLGDALMSLRNFSVIDEARKNYSIALEIVRAKELDQRTDHDYYAAIGVQRGMKSLGILIETDYEEEALERGILTKKQIDLIK